MLGTLVGTRPLPRESNPAIQEQILVDCGNHGFNPPSFRSCIQVLPRSYIFSLRGGRTILCYTLAWRKRSFATEARPLLVKCGLRGRWSYDDRDQPGRIWFLGRGSSRHHGTEAMGIGVEKIGTPWDIANQGTLEVGPQSAYLLPRCE